MIADILLILSLVVVVLTALELFLSRKQQNAFGDALLRSWYVLDDLKKTKLLDWLRRSYGMVVIPLFAVYLIGFAAFILYIFDIDFTEGSGLNTLLAIIFICIVITSGMTWFTLKSASLFVAVGRATLFLLLGLAMFSILQLIAWAAEKEWLPNNDLVIFLAARFAYYLEDVVIAMLFGWLAVALPVLVLVLLQGILGATEFVVRRIAEYPKGPIIAVSIFVGVIAAVFKAMNWLRA